MRTYDKRGQTVSTVSVVTTDDLKTLTATMEAKIKAAQDAADAIHAERITAVETSIKNFLASLEIKGDKTDVDEALLETQKLAEGQTKLTTDLRKASNPSNQFPVGSQRLLQNTRVLNSL